MRKLFILTWLTVIAFLLADAGTAYAGQDPPVIKVLSGADRQIDTGRSITVQDDKCFDPDYRPRMNPNYPVRSIISFEFNEGAPVYIPGDFKDSVLLEITTTGWNDTTATNTSQRWFWLDYSANSTYQHRNTFESTGFYRVKITVLQLKSNVAWYSWRALKIVNQLESFPSYVFKRTGNKIGQVSDSAWAPGSGHDDLPVWWAPSIGADEYDLEWAYVDQSSLATGKYGTPTSPDMDRLFANGASRVSITGTAYRIPLLYDQEGYLFYRVRAVQWKNDGGRNEAVWSTFNTNGHGRFNYDGHQQNLNWQATTSFAEEGKRKSVVQYYDGSFRGRQTVTKDNSVNRTIVAESFYDYQGRPVIQVLPAPTLNSLIGYTPNFNRGLDVMEYYKNRYDSLVDPSYYCTIQAGAMDTLSGASQYYSHNSPYRDSGVHKYVPDAGMFPFRETEYTQDNTGRINRQGGVGKDFRLGSGHETQYMYATPDQRELDALFGTEVGHASHYFKNLVRDANGQYSVSYVDMHGRTIATALAGSPPDSLKLGKLASNNTARRTERLSDPGSAVIKDLVMESKKSLAITMPDTLVFHYELSPQAMIADGCSRDSICYDCLYDLEITITDDCNNQKLPGAVPYVRTVRNFSLGNIDTIKNNGVGFSENFTLFVPAGNYEITKRLSVSREAIAYYRDSVVLRDTCRTLDNFIAEQRTLWQQAADCKPTCDGCLAGIGSWADFWQNFRTTNGIADVDTAAYRTMGLEAYDQAVKGCRELCDSAGEEVSIRKSMLMDMTPSSGQYANIDRILNHFSVFYSNIDSSETDRSHDTAALYTKVLNYRDDDGSPSKVVDESSGMVVAPSKLSAEQFVQEFRTSWADALLEQHPEYKKLLNYEKLSASTLWDKSFEATDTYAEAKAKGFLNPIGLPGIPNSKFGFAGDTTDPLGAFSHGLFYGQLKDSLNNYRPGIDIVIKISGAKKKLTLSMWNVATLTVTCPPPAQGEHKYASGPCYEQYADLLKAFDESALCEGELDMAWRAFRQMYLDVKRGITNKWITSTNCTGCLTATQLMAAGYQPYFSDANELRRLQGPIDVTLTAEDGKAMQQDYYASNCRAYAELWIKQLSNCNYDSTELQNVIIPALTRICIEGSDESHPYGASSVKPSSTIGIRSFDAWLKVYNASHGIPDQSACNVYAITAPKPYDQQAVHDNKVMYTKPDSCECTSISRLYVKYALRSKQYSSFSTYLKQVYQTNVPDSVLNLLLSLCGQAGFPAANCDLQSKPLYLPPVFQCNTSDVCTDCTMFRSLDEQYNVQYPGKRPDTSRAALADTAKQGINRLYEQFMNYKLGFDKTVDEYMTFAGQCGIVNDTNQLRRILDGYKASLTTKGYWVLQDVGLQLFDHNKTMRNGVFKAPDSLRNTSHTGFTPINYFNRHICLPKGYEIEVRSKLPLGSLQALSVYSSDASGGGFYAQYLSDRSTPSRIFMSIVQDGTGSEIVNRSGPNAVEGLPGHVADWHTYKCKVTPTTYQFYVDGVLIATVPKQPGMSGNPVGAIYGFYMATNIDSELDWVRISDHNGVTQYFEDFNDPANTASFKESALCPDGSCLTNFVTYFNQQKGTSLTLAQIQGQYLTQGINLDVCGLGKLNCDTLEKIAADFKAGRQANVNIQITYGTDEYVSYTDQQQMTENGALQLPYAERIKPRNWYQVVQFDARAGAYCWAQGYAVESRIKFLEMPSVDDYKGDMFYVFTGNLSCVFGRYSTGVYLTRVEDNYGHTYGASYTLFDSVLADSNPSGLLNWFTVKAQATPSHYYIYYNGKLLIDIPRNPADPFTYAANFTHGFFSRQASVDWVKMYNASGQVKYFEDFNTPANPAFPDRDYICPNPLPECQPAFVDYFNQQRGTNFTYQQIDSLYYAICGHYPSVCGDTTPTCTKLETLLTDYRQQVLKPITREITLPMRTFAGNKTSPEGPKGVFDVNEQFIGNTVDGTIEQINASFAQLWNSSPANRAVGTLSPVPGNQFRLVLNPGQTTPCNGIIGMRYYQFDIPVDSLDGIRVGTGSFIDFGDGERTKVVDLQRPTTQIYHYTGPGGAMVKYSDNLSSHHGYRIFHSYSAAIDHTITVYHSDERTQEMYFDCSLDCSRMPGLKNMRGYWPKGIQTFGFHSTQDSTFNSTLQIRNFDELTSIEHFDIANGDLNGSASTHFRNDRFESLERNHNLRTIWIDHSPFVPASQQRKVSSYLPNLPLNFPELSAILIRPYDSLYAGDIDVSLPRLRLLNLTCTPTMTATQIDRFIHMVATGSLTDSGRLVIQNAPVQRTSASDADIATLVARHWQIIVGSTVVNNPITDYKVTPPPPDSIRFENEFTDFINKRLGTNLTLLQILRLYEAKCGSQPDFCSMPGGDLTLCGRAEPAFPRAALDAIDNCSDSTFFILSKAQDLYGRYTDSLKLHFDSLYRAKCLQAYQYEQFTVRHRVSEYHHTLFYYDQAGNLIKTISPAGVRANYDSLWLDSVAVARIAQQEKVPKHELRTQYRYNTLNQVTNQHSPDGGKTEFWYDRLGRLALSRNARQLAMSSSHNHYYSYTRYDSLGRITEVGQVADSSNLVMADTLTRNEMQLTGWFNKLINKREQVTGTVYDVPYDFGSLTPELIVAQQNVRNRVSHVTYYESPGLSNAYGHRSYYSYDIHGNVDTLLQDYGSSTNWPNMMNKNGSRFKRFVYEYDLISGKVNKVTYQPGTTEQWRHRYYYDAENRLTEVETSTYSNSWEREVKYEYYMHGPLARVILGQQQVQGIDYAYTLQGRLKGINSTGGTETHDIGGDGKVGSLNQYVARDAIGLNLNYFSGDYKPINPGVTPFPAYRLPLPERGLDDSAYRPLYNGNISSMYYYNKLLEGSGTGILFAYQYDQLNRLIKQDAFANFDRFNNTFATNKLETYDNTFREEISYDANGNILTDNRNAVGFGSAMDRLTYHYYPGNNRLSHVNDQVDSSRYGSNTYETITDIDDQPDGNYEYDSIGNLVKNAAEKISSIKWNVYGKITEINRERTDKVDYTKVEYGYDAQGNRISMVATNDKSKAKEYTWYVRDAEGNLVAVYRADGSLTDTNLANLQPGLVERYIYGSKRLGSLSQYESIPDGPFTLQYQQVFGYSRGLRKYELSNHLGNVLSTISDKRVGIALNDSTVNYYEANIQSGNDYYPFGMLSRVALAPTNPEGQYRFGFNGKENDWKAKGWMNQQDYGMRIYDPRIGRFLSVDPLTKSYPMLTPYSYAENSPIENIDLDGLEKKSATTFSSDLPIFGVTTKEMVKSSITTTDYREVDRLINTALKKSPKPFVLPYAFKAGGLLISFLLSSLDAGVGKPEGDAPPGMVWGGDYYIPAPMPAPLPIYQPKDFTKPKPVITAPPKDEKGVPQYLIYETLRDHKQQMGIVDKDVILPYFGITSTGFSPGRYSPQSVEGKSITRLIGVTNRYIAKGAETALMLLNTSNWDFISSMNVLKSTQIDNEMISTGDYMRILAGKIFLSAIDPNWQKTYLRAENPKSSDSNTGNNTTNP